MLNHALMPDTQAILLLCASFGQALSKEPKPLTLREYNELASWLRDLKMRPADLLTQAGKERLQTITTDRLNPNLLVALLERGGMLALAVEKWTNQGLWVLGRSDDSYPRRLKEKLRHSAPAILYGVGNIELLSLGGLAVVGSRDVDSEGLAYTNKVAQTCAEEGIQVVSGGARGVDAAAMLGGLEVGGTAVGVLADRLTKAAVSGDYRSGIREGRLTLVSAYDPDAGFNVGNAMGRNKYIYALADRALVVSSAFGNGGTWAGAIEALQRENSVRVFVRMQGSVPEGNRQLIKNGAKPFPKEPWNGSLKTLLESDASGEPETQTDIAVTPSESAAVATLEPKPSLVSTDASEPKDIYEAVLPFILHHLESPKNTKSLAELLDVRGAQLEDWLKRAIAEGKVTKTTKPVAYVVNRKPTQLSLLEEEAK